jgi:hypothetical protein
MNERRPSILKALAVGAGSLGVVVLGIFTLYVIFLVVAMEMFGS